MLYETEIRRCKSIITFWLGCPKTSKTPNNSHSTNCFSYIFECNLLHSEEFTIAVQHADTSVSELRHYSGHMWLELVEILADSDRHWQAGSALYMQLYFPRESVTFLPPQSNTTPFSTGAPGHKEKSSNCHHEAVIWPFGASFSSLCLFS